MSSGDIDDRLAEAGALEELRAASEELNRYLAECSSLPIVRTCVPYTGGISKDLQVRFLDNRLDTLFTYQGRTEDVSNVLATHESTEGALRSMAGIGVDYAADPRGHRLANRAEYQALSELFGRYAITAPDAEWQEALWDAYDSFIDPQARRIEHGAITAVDPRMDLYPYADVPGLHRRLMAAQGF